ncbi:DUF3592 domain-containing protein [Nannocystis bainbridge]|uniref:DUF3592 domain-containing protein n=1 Tax=Nannocystis bainbridge TaxID=2995303 RepID=A0ABT5E984_9BACT|nr:DUF3592 domain-containing protein [Nannocystis bainbridge]MDC0722008.1 DUF3592 domain-containing protein [Nannocystis bainbridge]
MKLVWSLIAGLGGLFFAVGLTLLIVNQRFYGSARRTDGEVVHLRFSNKGSAAPDVAYTDHLGREHLHSSNVYSKPAYRVGEPVTIAFDPDDPGDAAIDSLTQRWLLPGIFGCIGLVHLGIGSTFLLLRSRRKREIARLLREGQRVDAPIVEIAHNTSIRVNRRSPWVIRCEVTLPGEATARRFVSRRFWNDPRPHLRGRSLPVCYDPRDPSRHVVDTGDLDPGRAFERRG